MHLRVRVDIHSLQGTVCAWVPPPPNDRLWFGFVSAPELRAEATPLLNQNVRTPFTACRCLIITIHRPWRSLSGSLWTADPLAFLHVLLCTGQPAACYTLSVPFQKPSYQEAHTMRHSPEVK